MSVQRRTLLFELAVLSAGAICSAGIARAQRPTNPIARPPRPRPDRPYVPGRFDPSAGGVPSGPLPGVFTVVAVDARENTIQLRDDGGRSGTVHVDPDLFDVETLKTGEQVEVDFLVPEAGSTKFEAAGIWKVQR